MDRRELTELIEKCRAGDPQAHEQLVEAVQEKVYFYCLRILQNKDDAQDAAQEALIAMLTGLNSLRQPEFFWTWMTRIIVRVCHKQQLQEFREARRLGRAGEMLESSLWSLDDQHQPDKLLDTEENRRMIVELVDALPESQRLCVLMYYYSEMSTKEIARAMGTSEGTVKSRLYYARQTLKRGLEGYAEQGFQLYGVSFLPFLQYFLQQEAAVSGLGTAAAGVTEAVLAAAGVSAAAGGAAAIGAAVKTALGVLAAKKAAVAAGLLLAGAITGGILCHSAQEVPSEAPKETVRAVSPVAPVEVSAAPAGLMKSLTEPQEPKPDPAAELVEPAVSPAALAAVEPQTEPEPALPPSEDPEPTLPPPPEPLPVPEIDWNLVLVLDPHPQTESEPVSIPVRRPNLSWAPEPIPDLNEPEPDEPEPDEPEPVIPDPVVPEPEPVNIISKEVQSYGSNSGYGYTSTFHTLWGEYLPPLDTYSSSDPSVVYIDDGGMFSTLSPGTAVLTAASLRHPDLAYAATIVVEEHFDWEVKMKELSLEEGGSVYTAINWTYSRPSPAFQIQVESINWTSSDPSVAAVAASENPQGCEVLAVSPGTATLTGDVTLWLDTAAGRRTMEDTVACEVTVEPAAGPEPAAISKELTDYGYNSGYGYTSRFADAWRETLPWTLAYESSDPEIVAIDRDGRFTTLASGTAVLTAWDTDNPGCRYDLTVQVEDCFQWSANIGQKKVCVGGDTMYGLTYSCLGGALHPISVQWTSSDPDIARVYCLDTEYWTAFHVAGVSPGTATITGVITVPIDTVIGTQTVDAVFTHEFTVEESPE